MNSKDLDNISKREIAEGVYTVSDEIYGNNRISITRGKDIV
jgi:hypothetical protein